MIRCIAGDVEIFPNMFSITFVDLNDYLVKCSCKSDDGKKDIPLINKYTVAEIKEKLYSLGAVFALMSGSGSALFGIFRHNPEGIDAAFPDCATFIERL